MKKLENGLILYHGSFCSVEKPDLAKCAFYKDFGRGFYLTTSKEQAENFAKISTFRKFEKPNTSVNSAYVSSFKVNDIENLATFSFETTTALWLHTIVAHRTQNNFIELKKEMETYDVICGKIANDNTNATITAYINGLYGQIGSEQADNICISLLLPQRLQDQFCFRTEKAIAKLEYLKTEKIYLE